MGIGSCEHSAKSSSNASSTSFIDADATVRLVAQNLLLCYIEASNYSLRESFQSFSHSEKTSHYFGVGKGVRDHPETTGCQVT